MENLKNKKVVYIVIGIIVILVIILVLFLNKDNAGIGLSSNNLVCNTSNTIIEGFNNKEEITFGVKGNSINRIKLDRTITIDGDYKGDGSYIESLSTSLDNAYNYLKDYKINKDKDSISVSVDTKKKGIVIKNLSISKNSELEDTSLRFDVANDLNDDKNSVKIGTPKKDVKTKLEGMGYTCK